MSNKSAYPTFCQPDDPVNISIYESEGSTVDKLTKSVFTENRLFTQHVDTIPSPQLRIISIHSLSSPLPLQISKDALEFLQTKFNIGPELWDLTSTFGNKPLGAAAAEGAMRVQQGPNGIQESSYRFTFPVTGGAGRWTIRQAGIFHRQDTKNLQNLWVFFHAGRGTAMEKELDAFASKSHGNLSTDTSWFTLHQIALTSCLGGWRSYVEHLGNKVDKYFGGTLSFIDGSMNNTTKGQGDGNLADIHDTRNRLLDLPSRLMTTLDTLQKLEAVSLASSSQQRNKENDFGKLATSALYYKEHLEPLVKGVDIIKEKVKDTLNMIEIGLSFRMTSKMLDVNNRMVDLNQNMLDANKQLLQLGNKNFDDNATVKIVTLVTLIYLPASLVSSVLGMNLFDFDNDTAGFKISNKFWIFIVATLILAVITLSGWFVWAHKEGMMRRRFIYPKQDAPRATGQDIEHDRD